MKSAKKYIAAQVIFAILYTCAIAIIPILHTNLIDEVIPKASFEGLVRIGIYYIIVIMIYLLFVFLSEKFVWKTAIYFENKMRKEIFSELTKLKFEKYSSKKTEEYFVMLTKNITQIEQDYLTPIVSFYKSLFSILIYGAIVFFYNKIMLLIILSLSVIVIFLPKMFKKRFKVYATEYIKYNEKYANIINELLKAFDMLDSSVRKAFNNKFSTETGILSKKRMRYGNIKIISNLVSGGTVIVLEMLVLIISVYLVMENIISIGVAILFFSYSKEFTEPLKEILYCINSINSTENIRKELEDFVCSDFEIINTKKLFNNNKIVLDNILVNYSDKKYLYNCSFYKGGKYIIYGESGAGKSTLLKIISGKFSTRLDELYDEDYIAYLSQEQIIFSDNFYNNVTIYGAYEKEDFNKYYIENKFLQLEDVSLMSGGEKQYIKVIRTLLQNKKIILLDEPTTGMDNLVAVKIMKLLEESDATIIMVTHNISIIDRDKWSIIDVNKVREIL